MKTIQCVIFVYLVVLSYTPIQSSSMKITIIIVKWTLPCQLTVTQHEKLQHYIPECSKSPLFQAFFKRKPTNRGWRLTTVMLQFEKMVSYFHTVCLCTTNTVDCAQLEHSAWTMQAPPTNAASGGPKDTKHGHTLRWRQWHAVCIHFQQEKQQQQLRFRYTTLYLCQPGLGKHKQRQKDSSEGKKYRSGADTYSCCTFHQNNYRMDKVCWMR